MGKKISEKGNKQEYREEWKKHWVSIRNKNRQGRDKTDMEGENENVRGRFCQQASTQTSSHVKLSLVNNRIFKIKTCFLHADFYLTVNLSKSFIYQLSMTQLTPVFRFWKTKLILTAVISVSPYWQWQQSHKHCQGFPDILDLVFAPKLAHY